MPRARHGRLTDTFIESLLPQEGGRERIVRDGAIPGFLIRVGLRKRTFELRIEKPPKISVPVGTWPGLCAVEARRKAEDLWDKHRKGEALDDRPPRDDETIATTWPRFKKRLEDDGRSERTIEGYGDVFKRLSERVKQRPLRELAGDPTIMEREVDRIREVLREKKRGGHRSPPIPLGDVRSLHHCLCSSRFVRLCGSAIVCLRPHCSIGTDVGRIFARHIQMDNLNKSFRPDGVRAESLRSLPVKEVGRRTKRFGGLRAGISSF